MVIELTLGNAITLVALVVAALWAMAKLLGAQADRRLDERFDGLAKTMGDIAASQDRNAAAVLELEREFRRHQADAARDFVRRDDFVRHVGVIETRIDNFALRMERALEHLGVRKGGLDA
jgi:hypothetical protein